MIKKILLVLSLIVVALGVYIFLNRDSIFSKRGFAEANLALGRNYLQEGEIDKALQKFLSAISVDPGYAEAYYFVGKCYKFKGQPPSVEIEYYGKAVQLESSFVTARIDLGAAYMSDGKPDKAREQWNEVLKINPTHVQALNNLGYLDFMNGDLKSSARAFKMITEAHPDNVEAFNHLGHVYIAQGKFNEAEKVLSEGLAKEPKNPASHYFLAQVSEKKGEKGKAIGHWEKAVEFGLQGEELAEANASIGRLKGKK